MTQTNFSGIFSDLECTGVIDKLFTPGMEIDASQVEYATTIIGGGIAGILLALRLSREPNFSSICLVESRGTLGGRLFFSNPEHEQTPLHAESFKQLWTDILSINGAKNSQKIEDFSKNRFSGFGFEALDEASLMAYERHIRASLRDQELELFENYCSLNATEKTNQVVTYIVKKEFTTWASALSGSSEIFTKKEAEIFGNFLKYIQSNEAITAESEAKPFAKSSFWQMLTPAQSDSFKNVFSTILTDDYLSLSEAYCFSRLKNFVENIKKQIPTSMLRTSGIELLLEMLLRARGVTIHTKTTVSSIQKSLKGTFLLKLNAFDIYSKNVCLALPLAKCFSFLPREYFGNFLLKWLPANFPRSIVAVEYTNCKKFFNETAAELCMPLTELLLPVEKVMANVTSADNIIFYANLEYEELLVAPSVREAVARIRKAAGRIFKEEFTQSFSGKKGTSSGNFVLSVLNGLSVKERVVLLSVGRMLHEPKQEMRNVKLAVSGLYCCGDNFTFSPEPWKNVIDSVFEVANLVQ